MVLARMAAKERGLFKGLEDRAKASEQSQPDIKQSQIFFQYTALLRELSQGYPLVIILDDLQWVDDASNALLFHLVRELKDYRIFFVGLYRPNDVSVGRNGDRHPLEQTLNETKRMYGDIWLDLDKATQAEGRAFVDALVDSEPNSLEAAFREQLYDRTKGHALFTTELLRAMQDRGDLVRDDEGRWQASAQLDWEMLPARIEGIIEERIERLDDELREILDVACVQGQVFIAEVIARVEDIKKRTLVKKLSELERCHRLVENIDEIRVGKTKLWNYTFSHVLFQTYLYNKLRIPERKIYHAEIAEALEEFYADQSEAIAVQLAYHYTAAKELEKAVNYLQCAGKQAFKLSDFLVARNFFTQALEIIEVDNLEVESTVQARLLWWVGETYWFIGQLSDSQHFYRQGIELAKRTDNKETTVQLLSGMAKSLLAQFRTGEALPIIQEALTLAQGSGDYAQECIALRTLGVTYGQMDLHLERLDLYQKSLRIATDFEDNRQIRSSLNSIGVVYGEVFGNSPAAIKYFNRALKIAQEDQDVIAKSIYLNNIVINFTRLGRYPTAKKHALEHLEIFSKLGNDMRVADSYFLLGRISLHYSKFETAIENFTRVINIIDSYKLHHKQVDDCTINK